MKRSLTLFLSLLCLCTISHAEVIGTSSLEWLADHCMDSGVYEVTGVAEKENENQLELTLTLKRTLRGEPGKEIKQDYFIVKLSDPKRSAAQKGDEFLICFQHYTTGEKRAVQTINLDNPQTGGFMNIAVSCEMKVLKTKQEILKVFEDRIKSHPNGSPVEISQHSKENQIVLQYYSEVYEAIYSGSTCCIRFPKDLVEKAKLASERLKKEAIKLK